MIYVYDFGEYKMNKAWPRRAIISNVKPYTYLYACIGRIDNDYVDNIIVRLYFGKVCDGTLTEEQFMDRLAELWGANSNRELVRVKAIGDSNKTSTIMNVNNPNTMIRIPSHWPENPTCDIRANTKCKLFSQCIRYTDIVAQSNVGVSGPPIGVGSCKSDVLSMKITDFKNYYYVVDQDDFTAPSNIAIKFGLPADKWIDLMFANSDEQFSNNYAPSWQGMCFFSDWKVGKKLHIPANWPGSLNAPPNNIKNFVPISSGGPQCKTGQILYNGNCIDDCPTGTEFDVDSNTCKSTSVQDTCPTGKYWAEANEKCLCKNRVGIDQPNNQPVSCDVGYIFNEDTCACKKVSNITKCQNGIWDDNIGQCYNPPPGVYDCPKGTHPDASTEQCVDDDKKVVTPTTETTDKVKPKESAWPWIALGGLMFVGGMVMIAAIKSNSRSDYGSDSSGSKKLEEPNIIKKIRQVAMNSAEDAYNSYSRSEQFIDQHSYINRASKVLGRKLTDYEKEIFVDTFDKRINELNSGLLSV